MGDTTRAGVEKNLYTADSSRGVAPEHFPVGLTERLFLRLDDFSHASVEALAKRATLKLFQLVTESYSSLQSGIPSGQSLKTARDDLSGGQATLLEYVIDSCKGGSESRQREIEQGMGHSHTPSELYYRLEVLVRQGFLRKRRLAKEGQFAYGLSKDFQSQM
jgi:hypothetical protein